MNSGASFTPYTSAVDILRTYFAGRKEPLGTESPSEYSFSEVLQIIPDWEKSLTPLLEKLRAASFRCTLTFGAGLYQWGFQVVPSATALAVSPQPIVDRPNATPLPAEAVAAQDAFKAAVEQALTLGQNLNIDDVFNSINEISLNVPGLGLTLRASLPKDQLQPQVEKTAKVVYYMFAENLVSDLRAMSLQQVEREFCEPHKRTVIVIFDMEVSSVGEYLAILGRDHDNQFINEVGKAVTSEALKKAQSTLEFRRAGSLGDFRTSWLTPDFLAIDWNFKPDPTLTDLQRQLQSLQALLSALFLANFVDQSVDPVGVEYRGIGVVRFPLDRTNLLKPECPLEKVYDLYVYAYEGFAADKVEIVQQFLSLMTSNDVSLCAKSADVKEAARKTYAVVLRDKVGVYFDALNKIQERLQAATDKSAESVISLSRDISNDLYKIAGVLAAAVTGAFLKPDLGWPVGLAASLVISAYLALVIFYHLATLTRAYDLGLDHYANYVESFKPVLGETRTQEFLDDKNLKQAKALFLDRVVAAEQWYAVFLILSLGAVQLSIHKLVLSK